MCNPSNRYKIKSLGLEVYFIKKGSPHKVTLREKMGNYLEEKMLDFSCDYNQGAHPDVLEAIVRSNMTYGAGYGEDPFSAEAKRRIAEACSVSQDNIFFLTGGTQTNQIVISTMLRSYEGVIAADSGHIATHEAGAIEWSGHKVIGLPHREGKISAQQVEAYMEHFAADDAREHTVQPGMVYISQPTEYGTIYAIEELEALQRACRQKGLLLYVDGARLGCAMAADDRLTFEKMASVCDIFYIGGTKMGALCSEAVVFCGVDKPKHFLTSVKQRGGLLAKGRLAGVQFTALFTDGLYEKIGRHMTKLAVYIRTELAGMGIPAFINSPTNQQFVIVEDKWLPLLSEKAVFRVWERYDGSQTVIRLVTGFGTTKEEADELLSIFRRLTAGR